METSAEGTWVSSSIYYLYQTPLLFKVCLFCLGLDIKTRDITTLTFWIPYTDIGSALLKTNPLFS
jgi:hypothetical protein